MNAECQALVERILVALRSAEMHDAADIVKKVVEEVYGQAEVQ